MIRIGTAGWSIPRAVAQRFAGEEPHLLRYARVLKCAEINSSFYRSHSALTYSRWAQATPAEFRFSVKLPQTITHENALRRSRTVLDEFLAEVSGLGRKQGALLIQLPPALTFESRVARQFFALVRERWKRPVVCEPRHASWFEPRAQSVLERFRIARVAADPAVIDAARRPGGWIAGGRERGLIYYRLHGSPRKYWSSYSPEYLQSLAQELVGYRRNLDVWCIFDNTASGAAAANALALRSAIERLTPTGPRGTSRRP